MASILLQSSARLVIRNFSKRSTTTTLSTPTRSSATTTPSTPMNSSKITALSVPTKKGPISSLTPYTWRLDSKLTGVIGGMLGGFSFFKGLRDFSSHSYASSVLKEKQVFATQKERIKVYSPVVSDEVDWKQYDMVTPTVPCSSAPFRPIKQGLYYGLTAKVGPGYIAERGGFSLIKRLCDFSSRSFYTSSVSSKKQDYYSVLGVSRTATQGEIKEAYKRLVKEYNPYTKPGDPQAKEKFAMVVEAFEVLSDEKTRKMYDDYGSAWLRLYAAQQQFGSGADTADEVELIRETFLDFAKDQDSEDFAPALDNVVELTFTEAVKGVYKDIAVDLFGSCPRCGGTGHHLGTEFSECPQCDGSGKEVSGPFLMTETCKKCDGSGIVMSSRCSLCKGTGQTRQQSTVSVAVPAGVKDGQSASISVGKKMIEVTFRVEESPMFRRDGDDVHSDMVISVADAILGGTTRAQGLYGTIDIPIPPGTQVDQKIRLAGKGFAHINSSSFGDHYVHIKIRVPRKISPLQRKLIESFAEEDRRWGSETWSSYEDEDKKKEE